MLGRNRKNRKVSQQLVQQLANDMATGNWKLNGETIVISDTGRLLDGQHRLLACLQADTTFETYVVVGVEEDVFDTLDCGKLRDGTSVFAMMEESSPAQLSGAATLLWKYENDALSKYKRVTNRHRVQILHDHPGLRDSMAKVQEMEMQSIIPIPVATFLHYCGSIVNATKTHDFLASVKSGLNLSDTDPAYVLREALLARAANKRIRYKNKHEVIAYAIKALNASLSAKPIKRLKLGKKEEFPVIMRRDAEILSAIQ